MTRIRAAAILFLLTAACSFDSAPEAGVGTEGETESETEGSETGGADTNVSSESSSSTDTSDASTSDPSETGDTSDASTTSSETTGDGDGDGTAGDTGEDACDGLCLPNQFCIFESCVDEPPGMAIVPAGSFGQGCAPDDGACEDDESPFREVELGTYAIDLMEITVLDYFSCENDGACSPRVGQLCSGNPVLPANCVTYQQAQDYCEWSGGRRLPTESEWERAARGEDARWFPWGNSPNPNCDLAVMVTNGPGCGFGEAWPGGSKPEGASPYGLQDVTGNLREWVSDWYAADYYSVGADADPQGPTSGETRITRGGSLENGQAASLRLSRREPSAPGTADPTVGFRCALSGL